MRELSVYYCKKCGFYAYYPLAKYAICPKCDLTMTLLPIEYKEFVNLNCYERDELLSNQIIFSSSAFIQRLVAPHKINDTREIIAILTKEIDELHCENKKLNETVEWMHQLLWQLIKKSKPDITS